MYEQPLFSIPDTAKQLQGQASGDSKIIIKCQINIASSR